MKNQPSEPRFQDLLQDTQWELSRLQSRLTRNVFLYILVHMACWLVWYMLPHTDHWLGLWPVYSMAGWGINILFATGELFIYALSIKEETGNVQTHQMC